MNAFGSFVDAYDLIFRMYMRAAGLLKESTQATTLYGAKLACQRRDFIQRRIAYFGLFEPNLTYFIAASLKPGDIFIDVGANIGYFTLLASKRVGPSGRVYAIEAAPSTYRLLRDNITLNGADNVRALNVAVAERECHARVHAVEDHNIGMNRVEYVESASNGSVPGRTLPAIVGADFARAKFIKVDVEGAEAAILPGIFDALVEADSEAVLVAEINEASSHLVALAQSKGFQVQAMPNNYSIGHLLVRSFLRRTREDEFFILLDTDAYISNQFDYVFSRPRATAEARAELSPRAETVQAIGSLTSHQAGSNPL